MSPKGNESCDEGNEKRPGPAELSQLGPHWTNLRDQAREALILEHRDADMQDALDAAASALASVPRDAEETDEDVSVRLTAALFDRVGSDMRAVGFDAHEAVMYMAEALWDDDTAMNSFLARGAEDSARESDESAAATGGATKEEEEIEEVLSEQELTARELNPNVDRMPAVKNKREPSKLVITLKQLGGKVDKVATFPRHNQGANLDWARSEHIRALNRWRSQVLRRELGEARPARIGFHDEEIQWLVDYHHQHKRDSLARTGAVDFHKIKWDEVTRAFNARFAGRILSGSKTPRPARTKPSLTTERYRIQAICDLVGLPMRNLGVKNVGKDGDGKEDCQKGGGGEGSGPPKDGGKKG